MTNRRAILTAAALAVPASAVAAVAPKPEPDASGFMTCPRASGGPNAHRFPQVVLEDQTGKKGWLYDDMIKDKLVLFSFTAASSEHLYPIIPNLVKVQEMLGDRLGRDVFMYTVTTKPQEDTPDALRKLAEQHGAKWQFLTGSPEDIREVLKAFRVMGTIHGLSWIGNEKTSRWASEPTRQHPIFIAEIIARLSTGKDHRKFLIDMHSV